MRALLPRSPHLPNRSAIGSLPLPFHGLSYAHIFLSFISRQISLQIQRMPGRPGKHFIFSSSRRTSGPKLSECVLVDSLGPGFRRDDGRKNEFNTLIAATTATKICESDSVSRERTTTTATPMLTTPSAYLHSSRFQLPPFSNRLAHLPRSGSASPGKPAGAWATREQSLP
jgi:hypothetical protein